MTGGERGQKNEVRNGAFTDSSGNLTGWNNWGSCTIRQVDNIDGINYAHIKTSGTKWAGLSQNLGTPLDVSSDYTLSFRAFSPTSHSICFGFHWCNSSGSIISQSWFEKSLTVNPTYYTIKIRSGSTADRFNMMIGWNTDEVAEIYFTDVKIESGNVPTTWIPHTSDSTYTTMGYNDNTEYDVSGYLHNGTINGSVSYSSDTARYSVSTKITDGRSNYISAPITIGDGTAITMNAWMKSLSGQTGFSDYHIVLCIDGGYFEFSIPTTGKFRQGFYINNTRKVDDCGTTNLLDTNWHMLTATFDGTSIKRYVDGTLVNTTSAFGTLSTGLKTLYIGKYNTDQYGDRNLLTSDVKVYATALSATQIAELYNTAVSISNNGVLMGYELVEQ